MVSELCGRLFVYLDLVLYSYLYWCSRGIRGRVIKCLTVSVNRCTYLQLDL